MRNKVFGLLSVFLISLFLVPKALATPSVMIEDITEQLVRGEEYNFVVTIDTLNDSIDTISSGFTYETEYLQLVSVTNGNFFDSTTYTEESTGEIILTGTSTEAKSGSGTFAIVRLKLIADSAGSSTLCSIVSITPTATPGPTTPPGTTPTTAPETPPQSCSLSCSADTDCDSGLSCINSMCLNAQCPEETDCICPVPTKIPPSAIPTSGLATGWKIGSILALGLISMGILGVILL
jgi:hypothetical protein